MVKVLFPAMVDKRRTMRRTLGVVGIGSLLLVAIPLSASERPNDPTPQPTKQQWAALGNATQDVDEPLDSDKTQPPASDTSSISVGMTSQSDEQSKVDVTVNGQTVPVPKQGTYNKRIYQDNGDTVIDVTVEGDDSSSAQVNSSTSIQVQSQSFSTGSNVTGDGGRHPARR